MIYKIIDAKLAHIRAIIPNLRDGDRAEIDDAGIVPRHLLYALWKDSTVKRAAFVDGEIAAIWGCAGQMLSSVGEIWLLTAPPIERVPLAFLKEARHSMAEMLKTKQTLISGVSANYERSIRFMKMIGFEIGEIYEEGPKRAPFHKIHMEAPWSGHTLH